MNVRASNRASGWLLATTLAAAGCCSAAPVTRSEPAADAIASRSSVVQLAFIDDVNFPHGTSIEGVAFGGLSALWYESGPPARLLAVSDAHGKRGPSRMFELALTLDGAQLRIALRKLIIIGSSAGPFADAAPDLEGLAPTAGGTLLVSSEGSCKKEPRVAPAIYHLDSAGGHLGDLQVPTAFAPTPSGPQVRGVRHNRGFESLTTTPSGRWTFAANEEALMQDGRPASSKQGTLVRVVRYDAQLQPVGQHAYLTDPVPQPSGEPTEAINGVAELTALDDTHLLVLERAAVEVDGVFTNHVRIYQVSLAGASRVENDDRLDPLRHRGALLSKSLVLDLDEVRERFEQGHRRIDNFEGMTLGPRLPDGRRSLIVVSDDNFSAKQRTAFLAFAIDE